MLQQQHVKSGHLHSRTLNTNQWQRRTSRMLQEWRTSLKEGDQKKKKNWPKLAQQKTNGGRMTSLHKCRKTKDTGKTWLAAHELPQLVAQRKNLTVDTSFPFAEFGILTIPFLPDYMQICKELTFHLTGKFNPTEMNKVWKPESKSQTPKY